METNKTRLGKRQQRWHDWGEGGGYQWSLFMAIAKKKNYIYDFIPLKIGGGDLKCSQTARKGKDTD